MFLATKSIHREYKDFHTPHDRTLGEIHGALVWGQKHWDGLPPFPVGLGPKSAQWKRLHLLFSPIFMNLFKVING